MRGFTPFFFLVLTCSALERSEASPESFLLDAVVLDVELVKSDCDGSRGFAPPKTPGLSVLDLLGGELLSDLFGLCVSTLD